MVAPPHTCVRSLSVTHDSLRGVLALHTCRAPLRSDDIGDVSWCSTCLQLRETAVLSTAI